VVWAEPLLLDRERAPQARLSDLEMSYACIDGPALVAVAEAFARG
jgi:hypothetical protein